jgi:serine/threonine protein kinase
MKVGKILIVEDNSLWQEFLRESLANEYSLTIVSDKVEAKESLNSAQDMGEPFNLVTVDIGLDQEQPLLEGGEDILAFVSQYHPHTKCIVVTGHSGVNNTKLRNYFKEFDVFDYIDKSNFDLIRFKQIVDRVFYFHGYRLLAELGRGGMGVVYKALDAQNDNRLVALKVLYSDPRLSLDEVTRRLARFAQEAETIRRLSHPNIVIVYDYRAAQAPEDQTFLVMEYLQGQTLEALLGAKANTSLQQIVTIGQQLCAALDYAHTQRVIHRDIKPSNIILLPDGQIKITDFGIAKVMDRNIALTKSEEIIGTLDYMPPEQILFTKEVDQRVDIYAAGAVLYELLTGHKPYSDPLLKLQQDPRSLQEFAPALPAGLTAAVMKALACDPNQRYHSASDMAKALQIS